MKQVALITGGNRGLGRHMVLAFARAGYDIAYTFGKHLEEAQALAKELKEMGATYHFGQVDVTSEDQVAAFFSDVRARWGRIDVLVNNAGTFENSLLEQTSLESWNRVLAVNLTGSFLTVKYALPIMKEQKNGRIVFIGSAMGETGIYGACSYGASKAGLMGLMKSVALEGARHGITANMVSIGLTDEGMSLELSEKAKDAMLKKIPANQAGRAEDLANIILDLCRPEMSYVTGQVIRFNGGMYM